MPAAENPMVDDAHEHFDQPEPPVSSYQDLQEQVRQLEKILARNPRLYNEFYTQECANSLALTSMFQGCPKPVLLELARRMERVVYPAGTSIETTAGAAHVIASGKVRRWSSDDGGKTHLATTYCLHSIGLLHLYNSHAKLRFEAECVTDVVTYVLHRKTLDEMMIKHPELATSIIKELSWNVRNLSHQLSTPFSEQKNIKISYTATALAASVESFYRSALNALINQKLTGTRGSFFPDMHVQVPCRVIYISGLKHIRSTFDDLDFTNNPFESQIRLGLCIAPGIIMCPFSSMLEATNAGASNPEPLSRRWMRGYSPRLVREVIFAVGINQLADFLTERIGVNLTDNPGLQQAIGSVTAGVTAGYFSHIPHVLSTLKLCKPESSYMRLWAEVYSKSMPVSVSPTIIPWQGDVIAAQVMSVLFPVGVVRRSVQIAGTFTIINGITYALRNSSLY